MHKTRSLTLLAVRVATMLSLLGIATGALAADSEQVLHSFCILAGCPGGANPEGKLIFDSTGNLYGATYAGGRHGDGTVFELISVNGKWRHKLLHSFYGHGGDGAVPFGGLVADGTGNLFGVTMYGGDFNSCTNVGCGVVFELLRGTGGTWTEKVLHTFDDQDGAFPNGPLVFDGSGNLYGTTVIGGTYGKGVAFELVPSNGTWTLKVLHNFNPNSNDGSEPVSALIFDKAGNLYGATQFGGVYDYGTVFELTPNNGTWTENLLYDFGKDAPDAASPYTNLVFDGAGNLYGAAGGIWEYFGVIFELLPANGQWVKKVLYRTEKAGPGDVTLDSSGNLYSASGCECEFQSMVFELTPGDGKWTKRVLHRFTRPRDGYDPSGPVVFDSSGNLYGLTYYGGATGNGTVFQIKP